MTPSIWTQRNDSKHNLTQHYDALGFRQLSETECHYVESHGIQSSSMQWQNPIESTRGFQSKHDNNLFQSEERKCFGNVKNIRIIIMSFFSKPRCRFCMLKVNNLKHGHLKGLLSTEITDSGFDSQNGRRRK
jgi:hypothetical protein